MRFVHIADLHLGKQMNDLSLLDDQKYILDRIADIVRDKKADGALIAGDVYQRSSPQAEAMALFDGFVTALAQEGRKVFLISGNHDSAQRLSYFSALIRTAGVYAAEEFDGTLQSVDLRDQYGELTVWLMPFIRPSQVRRLLPGEKINTYQDAAEAVLRQQAINTKKRNILLAHQFITGCETSESEERAVGGLENIDASVFADFDYVALGHIHKPQRMGRDTLRYAGSPLKYSFSEANHKKSVTVVDVEEKGIVEVHTVPLEPLRDVRLVEGSMDTLMRMPYSEDYVWATVTDEIVPPDARVTLSTVFPWMLKFSVANSTTKTDLDVRAAERLENKSVMELFTDFYRLQNNDQPPREEHVRVLEKVLRELEEAPHETA